MIFYLENHTIPSEDLWMIPTVDYSENSWRFCCQYEPNESKKYLPIAVHGIDPLILMKHGHFAEPKEKQNKQQKIKMMRKHNPKKRREHTITHHTTSIYVSFWNGKFKSKHLQLYHVNDFHFHSISLLLSRCVQTLRVLGFLFVVFLLHFSTKCSRVFLYITKCIN